VFLTNFENWEILAFKFLKNEPEAYNTAKTDFSKVKFSVLSIFEDFFFKSDAILNFFLGRFSENLSRKVNSQKRHYLKKRILYKYESLKI
jgi:hypothetical protein